jgi:hypothetical protein
MLFLTLQHQLERIIVLALILLLVKIAHSFFSLSVIFPATLFLVEVKCKNLNDSYEDLFDKVFFDAAYGALWFRFGIVVTNECMKFVALVDHAVLPSNWHEKQSPSTEFLPPSRSEDLCQSYSQSQISIFVLSHELYFDKIKVCFFFSLSFSNFLLRMFVKCCSMQ